MKSTKKRIFGLVLIGAVLVVSNVFATGKVKTRRAADAPYSGSELRSDSGEDECDEPDQIIECWWQDAKEDGVTCLTDSECSPHTCVLDAAVFGDCPSPTGEGLCRCDYDPEDFLGGFGDCPGDGVCNPSGICGPSYCNGHLICSCWGGCEQELFGEEKYETAEEYCAEEMVSAPYCCDGQFPNIPGTEETGYCSGDPTCGAVVDGGSDDDTDSDTTDVDASTIDASADDSDDSNKCDCRMTGIPNRGGLVRFLSGVF